MFLFVGNRIDVSLYIHSVMITNTWDDKCLVDKALIICYKQVIDVFPRVGSVIS